MVYTTRKINIIYETSFKAMYNEVSLQLCWLAAREGWADRLSTRQRVLGTQRHREHSWRRSHVLLPVLMYKWI